MALIAHGGTTSILGVSVPFARGTPPWPRMQAIKTQRMQRFSPLREGDTSVAGTCVRLRSAVRWFQSPSRGGHLRGVALMSSPG